MRCKQGEKDEDEEDEKENRVAAGPEDCLCDRLHSFTPDIETVL